MVLDSICMLQNSISQIIGKKGNTEIRVIRKVIYMGCFVFGMYLSGDNRMAS